MFDNRFSLFMIDYMEKKLSLVDNLLNTVQVYKLELVIYNNHLIIKEYTLRGLTDMKAHAMNIVPSTSEIIEGQRQFDKWLLDYIKSNTNTDNEEIINKIKKSFNANIVYENIVCEFCGLPSTYIELFEDQNKNAYILCPNCERDLSSDVEENLILKILK